MVKKMCPGQVRVRRTGQEKEKRCASKLDMRDFVAFALTSVIGPPDKTIEDKKGRDHRANVAGTAKVTERWRNG